MAVQVTLVNVWRCVSKHNPFYKEDDNGDDAGDADGDDIGEDA